MMLMLAPPFRPLSAVKLFNCTLTSPIASALIEWVETLGRPMSFDGTPSIVTVLH